MPVPLRPRDLFKIAVVRSLRGFPLQQAFEFGFDFQNAVLPASTLNHFVFPVVFVLEVLAVLGSYLLQFGAKTCHLLRLASYSTKAMVAVLKGK
jgi:hypothetical protein